MRYNSLIIMIVILIQLTGCSQRDSFPSGRWIDLSHDFSSETIYWPTSKAFELEEVFAGYTEQGFYYSANNFSAAEHGGTHIDAPVHFSEGRQSVDEIPLENLIAPAVVIDLSEKVSADRDYQVRVEDFLKWEAKNGNLSDGVIVLLHTGQGKEWNDPEKYLGTNIRGEEAAAKLHFPGLHPDAAKWLVENRNIKAIGLDTPSIDHGQSSVFKSHRILFDKNIPAFENVANLDKLPTTGFLVAALPMKIKGGSGAPLRIVAFIPEGKSKY